MNNMLPAIVSTAYRGVFFGYLPKDFDHSGVLRLERARMIVYWPAETQGFTGLAAYGPLKGAKVGPAAPALTLFDVTAVMEVTPEVAEAYETSSWSNN